MSAAERKIDAILRLPEVERISGLKRTAIYERMVEGTFPQRIPLGTRHVGWLESEVQAWIQSLVDARAKACADHQVEAVLAAKRSASQRLGRENQFISCNQGELYVGATNGAQRRSMKWR